MSVWRDIAGSLALAVVTCVALPALGHQTLQGRATVVDGDGLVLGSVEIRLYGIDAPEARQSCENATGRAYRCGRVSEDRLRAQIGMHSVSCDTHGQDRFGRYLAVCHAAGVNLNAWLVSEGLALAYRRFSMAYVSQEAAAQEARRGLWRGRFIAPWDWRRGAR